ncbi:MAG: MW1434 family type I TA system toxin, partial [Candidatus Colwellbacteria bacterium]
MSKKSQSPLPPKSRKVEVGMAFPDAMQAATEGKKVRRTEWADEKEYGVLQDTFLRIFKGGELHNWIISEGDMLAIDWVVVKEGN